MANQAAAQSAFATLTMAPRLHPRETNLIEFFMAQVKLCSTATAVECGEHALTYGELERRSNQLAHYLRRLGTGPETRVGVWLPRSLDLIVTLLAIVKAGGSYVPLDMNYPKERIGYILEDSQAPVLVTLEGLKGKPEGYTGRKVLLDAERDEIAREDSGAPAIFLDPENIAYLIYTSGSTGRPKAVAIRHKSVVVLLHWIRKVFSDEELSGVLASTSICFDMSVFEIFGPLSWGGRTIVVNNALDVDAIQEARNISLIDTVPSAMAELVRMKALPSSVKTVNLGGEALSTALVSQVYKIRNVERVYNLYGPSEDTTFSSYELVARDEAAAMAPIGFPLSNTDFYILSGDLNPVLCGETGELYIGGDGLARGYLNRPQLTAERFLPDPFSESPGARMYYTGDRVRHLSRGRFEYLGRVDHQVKIRGYRVELGEIEATLNAYPGIEKTVVIVWEDIPGQKRLVAYTVASASNSVSTAELRNYLQNKLPEYMVPPSFVMLERLPLTPNGKIDRHALPAPEKEGNEVVPQTDLEKAVAHACCEILGLQTVSMDCTFLELGGTSLNATRTIAGIREATQVQLPITALLGDKTLSEVAHDLEAQKSLGLPQNSQLRGKATRTGPSPAAFSQERIWFMSRMDPQSVAYHFSARIRFLGRLNKAALNRALSTFIERHEIYRTTLNEIEGTLCQIVHDPWIVELQEIDATGHPEVMDQVLRDLQAPFDLGALPLARWKLVRFGHHDHALMIVEHHVIHDGWSFNIFLGELTELYRHYDEGVPARISPEPLQFRDFAKWQREWMETAEAHEQLDYWKRTLAGCPPFLSLAYDRPRPPAPVYKGQVLRFRVNEDLESALSAAGQRNRATLFMLFTTALEILLYRYTSQPDFCIGTGIANRRWPEIKYLTGMVVNNLPLRAQIRGASHIAEVLDHVRKLTLEAYEFQDLPFDRMVQAINPVRDPGRNPIFQVMLGFHDSPIDCASLGDTHLIIEQALANGSAKFDFSVIMIPAQKQNLPAGYKANRELLWEYNSIVFDRATADQMAGHFIRVLEEITRNVEKRVWEVELLNQRERQQVISDWNQTSRPYPRQCVHELFEQQVTESPEAIAVDYGEERLTYAELNGQGNQLARYLKRMGAAPDSLIGLFMERSPQMIVAMLAALKAGAAYVPLDLSYPPERLRFMIENAGLKIILAEQPSNAELIGEKASLQWIDLKAERQEVRTEDGCNLQCVVSNSHTAYVMYTSGSTGKPKGIAIQHNNIVKLVKEIGYTNFNATSRVAQIANASFDAATFEIWGALLNGSCLIGVDKKTALNPVKMASKIKDAGINTIFFTTALFNQIAREAPTSFGDRLHVLIGGEAADPNCIRLVLEAGPPQQLTNLYGPTEGTTFSTWSVIKRVEEGLPTVPIGAPVANTQSYVLDEWYQPVPVGVVGQLFIGGAGLARGYLNDPAMTAQKFLPNPFAQEDGERLYGTGDLAKWRLDGALEFLGRIDHQVKIRGFRVELGEIETTLGRMEGVKQCVVVLREDQPGEKQLVAYLVSEKDVALEPARARRFLKNVLPDYMVPAAYVELDRLPVNANGKVDRQALPAPEYAGRAYHAPRTPQEEILSEIFSDVLSVESVGIDDNFFDLGGHSLMAVRLLNRVRAIFGKEISLQTIFGSPTVSGLSASLGKTAISELPVFAQQRPERLPLSYAQQRLWFMDSLAHEDPLYNIPVAFRIKGKLDLMALETSINEIIRRHEILRTRFCQIGDEAAQVVESAAKFSLETEDLRSVSRPSQERLLLERLDKEGRRPFDLARVPLLRLRVFQIRDEERVLLIVMHHIIADGWSLEVFYRELELFYAACRDGKKPQIGELPVQYADYALWQRERMMRGDFDNHLLYWKQELAGAPEVLEIGADHHAPERPSFAGATQRFEINEATTKALRQFSARAGLTLHMSLLGAYALLLYRASEQEEVLIGVPVANRSHESLQDLIGFFVNLLPIRIDFRGNPTFRELASRIKAKLLEVYDHQELPFERLVEEVKPERNLHRNPLFQTVFNKLNKECDMFHLPDMDCAVADLDISSAKFDLYFEIQEHQRRLRGRLICSLDLFNPETGQDLCRRFESLIAQIVTNPDQAISNFDLLLEEERSSLEAAGPARDLEALFRF